tara:strand:- start:8727 stop:10166 length:1440 start_codon:yes stop_codon:yes gene_type:complete
MNLEENLKDLTIIITIHERQYTLMRLFEWYKDTPINIVCVDNTSHTTDFIEQIRPDLKKASELGDFEYQENASCSYYESILKGLQSVKTKYCVIICDDDFLFPTGAASAIEFLKKNTDYVCALGQEAALNDAPWMINYDILNYKLKTDQGEISNADNKLERMKHACDFFDGGWVHAITHTETLKELIETHISWPEDLTNLAFFDKTYVMYMASKGKLGFIDDFYIIRSNEFLAHGPRFSNSHKKYNNTQINFKKDFLKLDLSPITECLNINKSFLRRLHKSIYDETIIEEARRKMIKESPMIVEFPFLDQQTYEINGGAALSFCAEGFPLCLTVCPSLGPGADFKGEHWLDDQEGAKTGRNGQLNMCIGAIKKLGFYDVMKTEDDWQSASKIYPIYKEENIVLFEKMLSVLALNPIGNLIQLTKMCWDKIDDKIITQYTEYENRMFFNIPIEQFLENPKKFSCGYYEKFGDDSITDTEL